MLFIGSYCYFVAGELTTTSFPYLSNYVNEIQTLFIFS